MPKITLDAERLSFAALDLFEALDDSLAAIHAVERLNIIGQGGYPRPEETEAAKVTLDAFLDKRRAALAKALGCEV